MFVLTVRISHGGYLQVCAPVLVSGSIERLKQGAADHLAAVAESDEPVDLGWGGRLEGLRTSRSRPITSVPIQVRLDHYEFEIRWVESA